MNEWLSLAMPWRSRCSLFGVSVRLEDRGETSDVTVLALTGRALPSTDLSAIDMAYDAIQRAHRDGRRSSVAGAGGGGGGVEGYKPIMAYVAAGSDPYLSLHLRQPQVFMSVNTRGNALRTYCLVDRIGGWHGWMGWITCNAYRKPARRPAAHWWAPPHRRPQPSCRRLPHGSSAGPSPARLRQAARPARRRPPVRLTPLYPPRSPGRRRLLRL